MDIFGLLQNTLNWLIHPQTLAYALAALGLAVHFGYTGLLNMGVAGFMAIGAYGYAMSVLHLGLPWYLAMLVALVAAAIFALILGIPTLRLRADYLAIVTLAAAAVVRYLLTTTVFDEWTNSADGLAQYHDSFRGSNPLPEGTYGIWPWIYNEQGWWMRVFGILLVAGAAWWVWSLMRSPWGRVIKGIREDEDAVRALGKNVFGYKMQSLIFGGVLAALGGIVISLQSAVVPSFYQTNLTFMVWTALLLGGAATVFGPIVGSMLFWFVMSLLDYALPALANMGILPISNIQAGILRFIIVGVALMLLVIFRPQGLFGNKKELTFAK